MNILDENIIKNQCELLKSWRIPYKQIGHSIGRIGLQDKEIISLIHNLQSPTFFTRDNDFFDRNLCHSKYCIVYLAVRKEESSVFIRRFLRHEEFNTIRKRMGNVIKVTQSGLSVCHLNMSEIRYYSW